MRLQNTSTPTHIQFKGSLVMTRSEQGESINGKRLVAPEKRVSIHAETSPTDAVFSQRCFKHLYRGHKTSISSHRVLFSSLVSKQSMRCLCEICMEAVAYTSTGLFPSFDAYIMSGGRRLNEEKCMAESSWSERGLEITLVDGFPQATCEKACTQTYRKVKASLSVKHRKLPCFQPLHHNSSTSNLRRVCPHLQSCRGAE